MGRNTADFSKDANAAFDTVQSWREELTGAETPRVKYKNNKKQNFMDKKPATNYGAKNGNSKENPAWATNRNNPKSPYHNSRGK